MERIEEDTVEVIECSGSDASVTTSCECISSTEANNTMMSSIFANRWESDNSIIPDGFVDENINS
jgi:hypothetical protein